MVNQTENGEIQAGDDISIRPGLLLAFIRVLWYLLAPYLTRYELLLFSGADELNCNLGEEGNLIMRRYCRIWLIMGY